MINRINKLKPQPDKRLLFFHGFLKRPQQVGSIIPSSRFMERRLVQSVDVSRSRLIVELGPGTGGTTRALLRAMPADARLVGLEINPDFLKVLHNITDTRFLACQGDAENIANVLNQHRLPAPDVILSGIPFSTMSFEKGLEIVKAAYRVLSPGGRFIAYQFRDRVKILGTKVFGRPDVEIELLNVPPMRIFRWEKQIQNGHR